MIISLIFFLFIFYIFSSIFYVYRFRGHERYQNFIEYFRKGWPIFTPFNCMLYMFTKPRAKGAILDLNHFAELKYLQDNWQTISDEVLKLHKEGYFDKTKTPDSKSFYDIGFRTFYKYGWSKFYLKWYGYTHSSAKRLCPKTVEILKKTPTVKGAMFSVLPVGSQLTRHLDPVASSLRYHLGLKTPNSNECFINIDGQSYHWRDGEALLFDETYLHYAKNNSNQDRLILMCDVERPLNFIGRFFNYLYQGFMRFTVVPNLADDKEGLVNRIFSGLGPILKSSKELKNKNKPLYLCLKYSVNITLFALVMFAIYGLLKLSYQAFEYFGDFF